MRTDFPNVAQPLEAMPKETREGFVQSLQRGSDAGSADEIHHLKYHTMGAYTLPVAILGVFDAN